jgi:hypothetical protein
MCERRFDGEAGAALAMCLRSLPSSAERLS